MAGAVFRFDLPSQGHTRLLARCLAAVSSPGDLILLEGDLGAGKTTFTRSFCEALGIDPRLVASPSFAIVHEYPGRGVRVAHGDLYRLGPGCDIDDVGLADYLGSDWIVVVEWGNFVEPPLEGLVLRFTFGGGGRVCSAEDTSGRWGPRMGEVERCFSEGEKG